MHLLPLSTFFKSLKYQIRWQYGFLISAIAAFGIVLSQLLNIQPLPEAVLTESVSPALAYSPIQPIPTDVSFDAATVELGQRLFQDPKLSASGEMSCATCHQLDRAGTDGLPKAIGNGGTVLSLNTPTVFNSGFNFRQN